jgi:hypothetical protein
MGMLPWMIARISLQIATDVLSIPVPYVTLSSEAMPKAWGVAGRSAHPAEYLFVRANRKVDLHARSAG